MTLLLDDSKKKIGNENSLCLCNGDSIMKSPVKMKENEDFCVHVQKGRLFIIGVIVSNFRMPGVYAWLIDSKDIFQEIESKRIDCFRSVDPEPQPESVLVPINRY